MKVDVLVKCFGLNVDGVEVYEAGSGKAEEEFERYTKISFAAFQSRSDNEDWDTIMGEDWDTIMGDYEKTNIYQTEIIS